MTNAKKTILVLEDEEAWALVTKETLELEGFSVVVVDHPDKVLKMLESQPGDFDAVVLDVIMDKTGELLSSLETRSGTQTGLAVAKKIKIDFPRLPIIGFSSTWEDQVGAEFRKLNLKFVAKPEFETLVETVKQVTSNAENPSAPRVFIAHGSDNKTKLELKDYLRGTLKLSEPLVLDEQPSHGRTIIEKFEQVADKIDVVFVILTADDKGSRVGSKENQKRRARQNVIFELGYFYGRIGRKGGRVIPLHKGDLELPSNISGIVYIDISKGIKAASDEIRKELQDWL